MPPATGRVEDHRGVHFGQVEAAQLADLAGVAIVASAGNDSHDWSDPPFYPAAYAFEEYTESLIQDEAQLLQRVAEKACSLKGQTANEDRECEAKEGGVDQGETYDEVIAAMEKAVEEGTLQEFTGIGAKLRRASITSVAAAFGEPGSWDLAGFSNRAAAVWAPGYKVISDHVNFGTGFAFWSGTSFAAPFYAACLASNDQACAQ